MIDLTERARIRVAELEKELDTLRSFLSVSEEARRLLGQVVEYKKNFVDTPIESREEAPSSEGVRVYGEAASPAKKSRVRDNPRPAVIIPAAIEILRDAGHPMSRRELHRALAERGLFVNGADPVKALGTILWRANDQIGSIEGRGYWPKGDAVPTASKIRDFDDLLS